MYAHIINTLRLKQNYLLLPLVKVVGTVELVVIAVVAVVAVALLVLEGCTYLRQLCAGNFAEFFKIPFHRNLPTTFRVISLRTWSYHEHNCCNNYYFYCYYYERNLLTQNRLQLLIRCGSHKTQDTWWIDATITLIPQHILLLLLPQR